MCYSKNMKKVNVLWTGGLDSSFRVCELARLLGDGVIQPYYIRDRTRGSIKYELSAISRITKYLRNHPATVATLNDVIIIEDYDIKPDKEITEAWEYCREKFKLGSQYDYLARFAKQYGVKLEIGLENGQGRSKAENTIKNELKLKEVEEGAYHAFVMDADKTTSLAGRLFRDLIIPLPLFEMTKLQEAEQLRKWGMEEVIGMTWFCHRPVFGLPCGHCNPCKDCLNEGMAYRVPKLGYALGICGRIYYGIKRRIR